MRFATNQWHSCHFFDGFSVLFEPDHVGSRKAFTQLLKEKILGQIQSVEPAAVQPLRITCCILKSKLPAGVSKLMESFVVMESVR